MIDVWIQKKVSGRTVAQKAKQLLRCFKGVIIPIYAAAVVNDAAAFVLLEHIQQRLFAAAADKQRKSTRLDLLQKAFCALCDLGARKAAAKPFFRRTAPVCTPVFVRAAARITAGTHIIFRTEAARKAAAAKVKFPFYKILRLFLFYMCIL